MTTTKRTTAMVSRRWQRHTSPPFALSVAKRSRSADFETTKPNRRKRMVRVWLALCACAVLLAGCVHATKANFPRHYTLNAAAPALTGEHATANANGKILQITNITVPDWLDGTAMYYRLDYERDGRLAAYANSDWIATPADRKSTRLNSSHPSISYAVFCLKKKTKHHASI